MKLQVLQCNVLLSIHMIRYHITNKDIKKITNGLLLYPDLPSEPWSPLEVYI